MIGKVVADESGVFRLDLVALEHAEQRGKLARLAILNQIVDLELGGAQPHALGHAPGDDHHLDPRCAHELDAESILNVVALELLRHPADIAEIDAAVSEHAVDIEADELDPFGERAVDHVRHSCQSSTARSITAPTSSRRSMFGPSLGAWSGSGCVSRNRPSAPAATAA